MMNRKYIIKLSRRYKKDIKSIKRFYNKRYCDKLRKTSEHQLDYLQYMPRMYQKLFVKNELIWRV